MDLCVASTTYAELLSCISSAEAELNALLLDFNNRKQVIYGQIGQDYSALRTKIKGLRKSRDQARAYLNSTYDSNYIIF